MRPLLAALAALLIAAAPAHAKLIAVTTTVDDNEVGTCSLRDAVRAANDNVQFSGCDAGTEEEDVILLQSLTYLLSAPGVDEDNALTGDLDVKPGGPVIISGQGAGTVIDANGVDRAIHHVGSDPLTVVNLTIRNGNPGIDGTRPAPGGAVYDTFGNLTIDRVVLESNRTADAIDPFSPDTAGFGGSGGALALNVLDPVLITDSVIRDNRTGNGGPPPQSNQAGGRGGSGGALYVASGSDVTIRDTLIEGNRTGDGGVSPTQGQGRMGPASAILAEDVALSLQNVMVRGNAAGVTDPPATLDPGDEAAIVLTRGALIDMEYTTLTGNQVPGGSPSGIAYGFEGGEVGAAHSILSGDAPVCEVPIGAATSYSPPDAGCGAIEAGLALDPDGIPGAGSAPVDAAGPGCPAMDVRGVERPVGPACDAGAIERGPASLTADPTALAFPATLLGATSAAQGVAVTFAGEGLAAPGAAAATGDFAASGCGDLLGNGDSCTLEVTFTPTVIGERTGTATLENPLFAGVALTGTGMITDPGPGPGPGGETPGRAVIAGATVRRRGKRVRARVTLTCPAGAGCAETVSVRAKRKRRRAARGSVAATLAGGERRVVSIRLKRAKVLRRRSRVRLRVRLVKAGEPTVARTFRRRVR